MSLTELLLTLTIGLILLAACATPTAPPTPAERPAPAPTPTPGPTPTTAPTPTRPETVTFPDEKLEAAISDAVGKPPALRILYIIVSATVVFPSLIAVVPEWLKLIPFYRQGTQVSCFALAGV